MMAVAIIVMTKYVGCVRATATMTPSAKATFCASKGLDPMNQFQDAVVLKPSKLVSEFTVCPFVDESLKLCAYLLVAFFSLLC